MPFYSLFEIWNTKTVSSEKGLKNLVVCVTVNRGHMNDDTGFTVFVKESVSQIVLHRSGVECKQLDILYFWEI